MAVPLGLVVVATFPAGLDGNGVPVAALALKGAVFTTPTSNAASIAISTTNGTDSIFNARDIAVSFLPRSPWRIGVQMND